PQGTTLCRRSSCDLPFNLNRIILSMTGDWALFLDDDNSFEANLLLRLLAHAYGPFSTLVDVVMPINIVRFRPLTQLFSMARGNRRWRIAGMRRRAQVCGRCPRVT